MNPLFRKLKNRYIWNRLLLERLTEPLHLNIISAFIAAFGSFRQKVAFDLIIRQQHAYSILSAADLAKSLGIRRVTLIEFGVASGTGLLNIAHIAKRVTAVTGVEFLVFGFDTGTGMPPPQSFRDHPELYQQGDFPMDVAKLKLLLPGNAKMLLGNLESTVHEFLVDFDPTAPIGFVSIDVDYYSSTCKALKVLDSSPQTYLPRVQIYLDDFHFDTHNSWCGELLAVREFNDQHDLRKIEHHAFLRNSRVMKNAHWIDHMMTLHVLDHPTRSNLERSREVIELVNPYL